MTVRRKSKRQLVREMVAAHSKKGRAKKRKKVAAAVRAHKKKYRPQ